MPSPETLLQLEADFKRIGVAHRASLQVLSQYNLKESHDWDVGRGDCHGLSVMWLAYQRTATLGTNLFKELENENRSPATTEALKKFTQRVHQEQGRGRLDGNDESIGHARTVTFMQGLGMGYIESKVFGGGWGKGHSNLGKYIGDNRGFYLVSVPGHAMAACSNRPLPAFYDPNVGEATFLDGASMGKFFSDYFKSTIMRQFSGGKEKTEVSVKRFG